MSLFSLQATSAFHLLFAAFEVEVICYLVNFFVRDSVAPFHEVDEGRSFLKATGLILSKIFTCYSSKFQVIFTRERL